MTARFTRVGEGLVGTTSLDGDDMPGHPSVGFIRRFNSRTYRGGYDVAVYQYASKRAAASAAAALVERKVCVLGGSAYGVDGPGPLVSIAEGRDALAIWVHGDRVVTVRYDTNYGIANTNGVDPIEDAFFVFMQVWETPPPSGR